MAVRKEKVISTHSADLDARLEIYNSAEEVVTDCRNRTVRHTEYDMSKVSIRNSWHGVGSYDEALTLLKDGYQPVVDTFREELKVAPREGKRISFNNSVQGFAPIVPLALKCVPNSMMDMRMKPIKTKVIDVYYDMTASASKTPEEFTKAGKALLGTIIELEKQGYRFNLYAIQSYYYKTRKSTLDVLCIKIKSSDRPLDLKRMCFPLTHPAFFRVIGFDWQSKSPITRYNGSRRGWPLTHDYSNSELKEIATNLFGTTACYVSGTALIDSNYDKQKLKEVFTNVGAKGKK